MLARGILDVLRMLSADAPLIVAVDDAQWLDQPSAGVLDFCLRLLRDERICVILTFIAGQEGDLEQAGLACE